MNLSLSANAKRLQLRSGLIRSVLLRSGLLGSLWLGVNLASQCLADGPADVRGDLLLVVGSPGTEEYRAQFRTWGRLWITAANQGGVAITTMGIEEDDATLDRLRTWLAELAHEPPRPLWVVLLGHGTFDGRTAKFNLPGPDLNPQGFATLLEPLKRPVAIVHCAAASGPFLEKLSAPNRTIVTATSHGNEINFARFGRYLAESILSGEADLDKDEQVSLLEAFLHAARRTEESYAGEAQLATEHASLDDNGDGRPVPASGFDGLQPVHRQDRGLVPDGVTAHQWVLVPNAADARYSPQVLAQRHLLERKIIALKERRAEFSEEDYYSSLELLLVQLARLVLPEHSAEEPPAD